MNPEPSTGSIFNRFSSSAINETSEFLQSNSLVAKVAFLLLVVFVFIIILQVSLTILGNYYSSTSANPHLIDGMIDATTQITIPQDGSTGSIPIIRSVNANTGIEFTWSVWVYINGSNYNPSAPREKYQNVFYKGNDVLPTVGAGITTDPEFDGVNYPNNSPGLYIAPNTNELVVFMNTYDVINDPIRIPDIPLNKWVNVVIRCKDTTIDVYINGTVIRSVELSGIPKQNYGDVYVAKNGGFSGYISNLWYYNYALNVMDIQKLVVKGPNTKVQEGTNALASKDSSYISLRWFFANSE